MMARVTAVHCVKTVATENYMVMLLDQPGRRVLPMWVGPYEGFQILLHLRHFPTRRPMPFQLLADLLDKVGIMLQEVRIQALKDDIFYAVVKVHNAGNMNELDARPSDAIALALHTGSPIYVADNIMASEGKELPDELWDLKSILTSV